MSEENEGQVQPSGSDEPVSGEGSEIEDEPKARDVILHEANAAGLSDWKAERLLRRAESSGLIHRWTVGRNRPSSYARIPQPEAKEDES